MTDIISADSGGMDVFDTQTERAKNILSVQLGALEYEPLFGIDLKYFLTEGIAFQNASFQAYLVERLANYGINVVTIQTEVDSLMSTYKVELSPEETNTSLVAR